MTPRQKQVLAVISTDQPISRGEIAKRLKISPQTTEQHLAALRVGGHVHTSGCGRFTVWRTTEEVVPRDLVGARVRSVFEWRP